MQKTENTTIILKKKNKARGLTLTNMKIYFKLLVIGTVWYWCQERQINLWNRIETKKIGYFLTKTKIPSYYRGS